MAEQKPIPNAEEVAAAFARMFKTLRDRSFSERHPELGKMINCVICGHRHYENSPEGIHCKAGQKFARRWGLDNDNQKVYSSEELIAGQTPETETVIEERKNRAAPRPHNFSKPRRNPHSNRWLQARENYWNSVQLEYKRRMAKPLDLWDTDPKIDNGILDGEGTGEANSSGVQAEAGKDNQEAAST